MRAGTDRDCVVSIGLLRESLRGPRKFGCPVPNLRQTRRRNPAERRIDPRVRRRALLETAGDAPPRREPRGPPGFHRAHHLRRRKITAPSASIIHRRQIERLGDQLRHSRPCSEYVARASMQIGSTISIGSARSLKSYAARSPGSRRSIGAAASGFPAESSRPGARSARHYGPCDRLIQIAKFAPKPI